MNMSKENKLYDVAIVGYGPAGVTAGIYAARKKLKVVLLGEFPGGEVRNSGDIENWPGDGETDGNTLAEKFVGHLKLHDDTVDIKQELVSKIVEGEEGEFELTSRDEVIRARSVVYAAGRHPRKLGVPGEDQFKNLGVSYCATCDAPLFGDKAVAVIGGGNTGAEAVIMLKNIARKVYLLHIEDTLPADPVLVENFEGADNVEIIYRVKTTEIKGDKMVTGLVYEEIKSGEAKTLEVQGVFVNIGAIPNSDPVKDLVELDKYGAVKADRYGQTNVEGFMAAGDVTDIRDAQIVVAAGQGSSAALSAGNYLARAEK